MEDDVAEQETSRAAWREALDLSRRDLLPLPAAERCASHGSHPGDAEGRQGAHRAADRCLGIPARRRRKGIRVRWPGFPRQSRAGQLPPLPVEWHRLGGGHRSSQTRHRFADARRQRRLRPQGPVTPIPMRLSTLLLACAAAMLSVSRAASWPDYGGTPDQSKYVLTRDITKQNVSQLEV